MKSLSIGSIIPHIVILGIHYALSFDLLQSWYDGATPKFVAGKALEIPGSSALNFEYGNISLSHDPSHYCAGRMDAEWSLPSFHRFWAKAHSKR